MPRSLEVLSWGCRYAFQMTQIFRYLSGQIAKIIRLTPLGPVVVRRVGIRLLLGEDLQQQHSKREYVCFVNRIVGFSSNNLRRLIDEGSHTFCKFSLFFLCLLIWPRHSIERLIGWVIVLVGSGSPRCSEIGNLYVHMGFWVCGNHLTRLERMG